MAVGFQRKKTRSETELLDWIEIRKVKLKIEIGGIKLMWHTEGASE